MPISQHPNDFVIAIHSAERIVEVLYPASATPDMFDSYMARLKHVVRELGAPWMCLVDQRAMAVTPEGLTGRISQFNGWAQLNGMSRSARVVPERLLATLQASHILQTSGVRESSLHHTREHAWLWLVDRARADAREAAASV